jgi:hypothetical protein
MTKKKKVNGCDVWYFFGGRRSKGRKNDDAFHNGCLDYILNHYVRTLKEKNLQRAAVWTDNCAAQYKLPPSPTGAAAVFRRYTTSLPQNTSSKECGMPLEK